MRNIYPLDAIIQSVPQSEVQHSDRHHYYVGLNNQGTIAEPTIWNRRSLRYFRITPDAKARFMFSLTLKDVPQPQLTTELSIMCKLSCPPTAERKVAAALGRNAEVPLQHAFERFCRTELTSLMAQNKNGAELSRQSLLAFVNSLFTGASQAPKIARELTKTVARDIGLSAEFDITPIHIENLTLEELGPNHIEIHVSDYRKKRLDLEYTIGLDPDPSNLPLAHALYPYRDRLRPLVEKTIQCCLQQSATLDDLHETIREKITRIVEDALAAPLRVEGRIVEYVDLKPTLSEVELPATVVVEALEFSFRLEDANTSEKGELGFTLELTNRGRFYRGDITREEFQQRASDMAKEEAIRELSETDYIGLLRSYSDRKDNVGRRLTDLFDKIGYRLKAFSLRTDLPIDELSQPLKVTAEQCEFSTKIPESTVKLSISLEARIDTGKLGDNDKVTKILERRENICAALREAVVNRLKNEFININPKDFYLNFDRQEEPHHGRPEADIDATNTPTSVEERLRNAVRDEVVNEFGAEMRAVQLTPEATELVKIFKDLQKPARQGTLVDLDLRYIAHGEPFIIDKLVFKVEAADSENWHVFEQSRPTMDDLREAVADNVRQFLEDQEQMNVILARNEELEAALNRRLVQRLIREFGLLVKVLNVIRRPHSEITRPRQAVSLKVAVLEKLHDSYEQIADAMAQSAVNGLEEDLQEARNRLVIVENMMSDVRKGVEGPLDIAAKAARQGILEAAALKQLTDPDNSGENMTSEQPGARGGA